jgi:hypothetical protein
MTELLYTRPAMSPRIAQRAKGRVRLRPNSRQTEKHWAHRVLDTVAAGMDVRDRYIDRALRILGDMSGAKA